MNTANTSPNLCRWEYDMHLYVKEQKVQPALFGTAAVHRAKLAAHLGL